jgi:hypothetical protein
MDIATIAEPRSRHVYTRVGEEDVLVRPLRRGDEDGYVEPLQFGLVVLGSTKLGGREGPAIAKARFTRTNSTSSTAVLAITTPEDEEGFEVGTLLLRELITEALEQGVDRFRTETHHNTPAMFRLLARFGRIKLRPSGVLELAIARS